MASDDGSFSVWNVWGTRCSTGSEGQGGREGEKGREKGKGREGEWNRVLGGAKVTALAGVGNGKGKARIVIGGSAGEVMIYGVEKKEVMAKGKAHGGAVKSINIIENPLLPAPNSKWGGETSLQFITVGNDASVCVWSVAGQLLSSFFMTSVSDNIHSTIFVSDNHLVVATDSPLLFVYSLPTYISMNPAQKEKKSHNQLLGSQHRDSIQRLCRLSKNLFASASLEGVIVIWKDTLQGHGRIRVMTTLNNLVANPSNKSNKIGAMIKLTTNLLAVAVETSIMIFDALRGEAVLEIPKAHSMSITHLESLYSNQVLVSASVDTTIKLWNLSPLFGKPKSRVSITAMSAKSASKSSTTPVRHKPVSATNTLATPPISPRVDLGVSSPCKSVGSMNNLLKKMNTQATENVVSIVSVGVVSPSIALIVELPGHTASISHLVKTSEYSFFSADNDLQMFLWKDDRIASEVKNVLCALDTRTKKYSEALDLENKLRDHVFSNHGSDQNLMDVFKKDGVGTIVASHSSFISVDPSKLDDCVAVLPPLESLSYLPGYHRNRNAENGACSVDPVTKLEFGPVVGCGCIKCVSQWCPSCIQNHPLIENDHFIASKMQPCNEELYGMMKSDSFSYDSEDALSLANIEHQIWPTNQNFSLADLHKKYPSALSLNSSVTTSGKNSPFTLRSVRLVESPPVKPFGSKPMIPETKSVSSDDDLLENLVLERNLSEGDKPVLSPSSKSTHADAQFVKDFATGLVQANSVDITPFLPIQSTQDVMPVDSKLLEALEVAKKHLDLSLDEICFELRSRGFTDAIVKSVCYYITNQ